jgi:hypothetical protein
MLTVNNPYHQKLLRQIGYYVDDFFTAEQIDEFKAVFHSHFSNDSEAFYSTSFHEDMELKQKVNRIILEKIQSLLDEKFSGIQDTGFFLSGKETQSG